MNAYARDESRAEMIDFACWVTDDRFGPDRQERIRPPATKCSSSGSTSVTPQVDHFGSELVAGASVYGIKAKLRQKQAKIEQTLKL